MSEQLLANGLAPKTVAKPRTQLHPRVRVNALTSYEAIMVATTERERLD